MSHYSSILFCLTFILLIGCETSKSSVPKKKIDYEGLYLFAWNEDTIHTYKFALTKGHKFHYLILNNDSLKTEEHYSGTYSTHSPFDTIFLEYDKAIQPKGVTSYLVMEVSGGYLIQPFDNNPKRVFLRIQRLGY